MNLNNNGNGIIKVEARHEFTLFPKYPIVLGKGDDNYGIVKWSISNVIEGEPIADKNDCITVTGGYDEEIDSLKTYTILAKEIEHSQYGKQYQLIFIGEILDLSNVGNQKAFLKTFLTTGQINEMFKVLENPLKTIQEHDIESLKKVHGVGDYISETIIRRYEKTKDYCNVYLELDELGLTPNFIQKLISKYHNPNKIIKIVKENPYQLSFDIEGIGFKNADKIALKNGMNEKSPERIKGYINYLLNELGEKGNSFITAGELAAYIYDEFDGMENIVEVYIDEEGNKTTNIGVAIEELENKNIIIMEKNEKKTQRRVYLKKYWDLENAVAKELKRIGNAKNEFEFIDWQDVVKNQELKQGWKFTDEQREGIKECLDNQIIFITGLPGSGKSSVLTGVLQALRCYEGKYSFAQCALAGRAGARMQEITGEEGSTIYRLLGYKPGKGFKFNKGNKLPYDIIILDEISLVGGEIFLSLIEAIKTGSKLILLGDMHQLSAIGCMNLAEDMYNSKYIKVVELTKIHRQAQKSGIIVAARNIKDNEKIFDNEFTGKLTIGELQDMHFSIHQDKDEIRKDVIEHFKNYWNSDLVNDIMDIQILVPVKERGDTCVFNLNSDIQEIYNPPHRSKAEFNIKIDKEKSFILRVGDKVMNLKNNYKLFNTKGEEAFVFNGWIGTLETINTWNSSAIIYFPIINDRVIFDYSTLKENITLGYSSTIHKMQGSSAKVIIGAIDYSTPPNMRVKELVYTLLTRAEKECVLIGQNKAINEAIKTSGISYKQTFLCELLDAA